MKQAHFHVKASRDQIMAAFERRYKPFPPRSDFFGWPKATQVAVSEPEFYGELLSDGRIRIKRVIPNPLSCVPQLLIAVDATPNGSIVNVSYGVNWLFEPTAMFWFVVISYFIASSLNHQQVNYLAIVFGIIACTRLFIGALGLRAEDQVLVSLFEAVMKGLPTAEEPLAIQAPEQVGQPHTIDLSVRAKQKDLRE